MKRMIDISVSLILLLVLIPLMVPILIGIKINMGSPLLFCQQRPGLYGKPFILNKFRTMLNGEGIADELRLTPLGRFLRKYSLDEFPQLINVLKGDMSLVGPRPLLMEYLPLYSKEQYIRHHAKPGITGWAQVNGRNAISWEEKFLLDVWYVKNQSFLLDMKILAKTLIKVIKKEGITQQGHVTMEKFRGSKEVV
ncbi:sugar transferase [Rossellomorea vietnamensis]|uniref:Sugar transferase n=1 Tax=Rossellomorea vietnamensis TaxID=218284 RepID=A0A0P6WCG3_9BACI|nr:sugar transferase [Rossellomorea vietnamensis]KPL57783.1 sugar transferase [Rossellomorea vietnamensis]